MGSHYDPDAAPTFWRLPEALWEECRRLLPPEKPLGTTLAEAEAWLGPETQQHAPPALGEHTDAWRDSIEG